MTTYEMNALPIGTRVVSVVTGEVYEAMEANRNDYKRNFRKVGKRGLSTKVTAFQGKRIALQESKP
jgi:hypothetical protein